MASALENPGSQDWIPPEAAASSSWNRPGTGRAVCDGPHRQTPRGPRNCTGWHQSPQGHSAPSLVFQDAFLLGETEAALLLVLPWGRGPSLGLCLGREVLTQAPGPGIADSERCLEVEKEQLCLLYSRDLPTWQPRWAAGPVPQSFCLLQSLSLSANTECKSARPPRGPCSPLVSGGWLTKTPQSRDRCRGL